MSTQVIGVSVFKLDGKEVFRVNGADSSVDRRFMDNLFPNSQLFRWMAGILKFHDKLVPAPFENNLKDINLKPIKKSLSGVDPFFAVAEKYSFFNKASFNTLQGTTRIKYIEEPGLEDTIKDVFGEDVVKFIEDIKNIEGDIVVFDISW